MDYCINHTSERAVGRCGTCQRPACYRCSLTIDQIIYCSTACFNERPAKAKAPAAPEPAPAASAAALADEFSDVVAAIDSRVSAAERAALTEPFVVLSAHLADDNSGTTMLGMTPVPGLARDASSTLIMAGTRRALLSSSCFFHGHVGHRALREVPESHLHPLRQGNPGRADLLAGVRTSRPRRRPRAPEGHPGQRRPDRRDPVHPDRERRGALSESERRAAAGDAEGR